MFRSIAMAALMATSATSARAAEISIRPDLAPHLSKLKTFYGGRSDAFQSQVWDPSGPGADEGIVYISGPIEKGDAERLEKLIVKDRNANTFHVPIPFHVVLNSPGGNFVEAVKMGEFLAQWRYGNGGEPLAGVFVLNGQRCMSACAMTFSLAVADRDGGSAERFVEVGAELGFHMPFLPPGQAAQSAQISAAMDVTYDVMSEFLKLVSSGRVPIALAHNALHYRTADEFLFFAED
ncbi:MAG: hypothetical protein MK160_05785 [Rhodobacteraceae bacterium]|nr:hypothetical protein [Paracoccaceae bacterium]